MKRKSKKAPERARSLPRILDIHSRFREAFDGVGTVRVYLRLVNDRGRLVKGNMARSITVGDATVTQVFAVVRRALEEAKWQATRA